MELFEQVEILLVEDNDHDAELTMRGLKKGGLANRVMWVKNGELALDYLFRRGIYKDRDDASPRLVLLDLKMPGMDGIEVLRAVKADERTRRIPIVVMTSSQEESDVESSYDLGVNSYVVKPVDFGSVADVVHQAGYYWLAINRTP
ncbi:MAG: response regulator [Methylophilaceae bacterium]|jgi:two-component system response regulator|uniref:response regulator n=1 Tax=Methylibium sp. Root1272 TaxID=1736441 RepID=UPI0006F3F4C5|nr:response regulator [Methylibium sp. Root1272]KQW70064.1 two-component system response regulator [Methylibium sp. Root1272]